MKLPLYTYINYVFKMQGQHLIAINGTADHVHLLFRISSTKSIADLMRDVKALSSRFVNEKKLLSRPFYWEQGYRAFSCSSKQLSRIKHMIQQQEDYHKDTTIEDEYMELMGERNINFNKSPRLNWISALNS